MFQIRVQSDIEEYCKYILRRANFGQRSEANGSPEEQLTGIIGQQVLLDVFHKPLLTYENGFDGGVDLTINGLTYDVKTMGRNCDPQDDYVNNLIALQANYKVDRYIFCSYNKLTNMLSVCGWINKSKFFDKANFYDKGTRRYRTDGTYFETKADLYEIENYRLNQADNLIQFKQQLEGILDDTTHREGTSDATSSIIRTHRD